MINLVISANIIKLAVIIAVGQMLNGIDTIILSEVTVIVGKVVIDYG